MGDNLTERVEELEKKVEELEKNPFRCCICGKLADGYIRVLFCTRHYCRKHYLEAQWYEQF